MTVRRYTGYFWGAGNVLFSDLGGIYKYVHLVKIQ